MFVTQSQKILSGSVALRFLLAVLVAGLLFLGLILAMFRQDVVSQRNMLAKEAEHVLDLQKALLLSELSGIQSDLLYLANQDVLQHFLSDSDATRVDLQREYVNFAQKRKLYDQIRFLDTTGMELVRINYQNGAAENVPPDELLSKAFRYYFRQSLSLEKD